MSENCDVIVIFRIFGKFGAVWTEIYTDFIVISAAIAITFLLRDMHSDHFF